MQISNILGCFVITNKQIHILWVLYRKELIWQVLAIAHYLSFHFQYPLRVQWLNTHNLPNTRQ